jgi:hypothetical protein
MPIYRFQAWRGWLGAEAEPLLMPQRSYQIARLMIIHNAAATKHPIMTRVSQAPISLKATPPPGSGDVVGFGVDC